MSPRKRERKKQAEERQKKFSVLSTEEKIKKVKERLKNLPPTIRGEAKRELARLAARLKKEKGEKVKLEEKKTKKKK